MTSTTEIQPLSVRKLTAAEVKSVDVENGTVTAVVSDESVDRDGDIIRVVGWQLEAFRALPVMLADHEYSIEKTIGKWKDIRIEGTQLIGTAEYFLNAGNELAEHAFALAQRGLAAFSVGFKTYPEHTTRLDTGGSEYKKQELLEISQVAIPANPHALAFAKQISVDWESEEPENESKELKALHDIAKDLQQETNRLEGVMNDLMRAIVQINAHIDSMYEPAQSDTTSAEEKPDPSRRPQSTVGRSIEEDANKLLLSVLQRSAK
jgi:hypothetical protein